MALALGMSVRRAQQEIDAREFAEWKAFGQIEPFGEVRADLRAAIIATAACNAGGIKAEPGNFMPRFDARHEMKADAVPEKVRDVFGAIAAAMQEKER